MTTADTTPSSLPQQPTAFPSTPSTSDRTLAALCHVVIWLNSFSFCLGILLPLILLLTKRNESPFIAAHAKESLNFQISMLIYVLCSIPLILVLIGIPLLLGVVALSFICPIIGTIRAADGASYSYPFTIRFI